jgi:type II secretory pathway component PulK
MMRKPKKARTERRAVVLFAVLVVVSILALAAYHYSEMTMAEYKLADSHRRSIQAHAAANSGIHYAAAMLSDSNAFQSTLNGYPYDSSSAFQAQIVGTNDRPRWQTRFSVIAPASPDDSTSISQAYRYGVLDESGKINLNALLKIDSTGNKGHDILMMLPNMTEDIPTPYSTGLTRTTRRVPAGRKMIIIKASIRPIAARMVLSTAWKNCCWSKG